MTHSLYMSRCLELAKKGSGLVHSNPLVGCVIVKNDKIIGEGYHHEFGGAHAEINAINSVANKDDIIGSTVYVSLEPCSHFGKTPPCANALTQHQVKEVVICNIDPHEKVAGKGIQILEDAGITVSHGVLENEGKQVNRVFFCNHKKKRPYVSLKWAESQDGFIAPAQQLTGQSHAISNDYAQLINHSIRSVVDAIIIGKNTFLKDRPQLSTRYVAGKTPKMVLLDSSLETKAILEKDYLERDIIILNREKNELIGNHQYVVCSMDVETILAKLFTLDIQHIMVEGGQHVLSSFIESGIWDEAHQFISSSKIIDGIEAPKLANKLTFAREIGNNTYHYYLNA